MSNGWFTSLGIVALLGCSGLAFDLKSKVTPEKINPGQRLTLEIRIKGATERPEVFDELLSQQKGLILLDRSEFEENGEIGLRYALTHYEAGEIHVPPIMVRVGADSQSTDRVTVMVEGTRVQGDEEIREEFGTIGVPFSWDRILRLATVAFVSFGIFYFLREWFGRLRWRGIKQTLKPLFRRHWPKRRLPVKRWAAEQLRVFRIRFQSEESVKDVLDDWAQFCRVLMRFEGNASAQCWTISEMRNSILSTVHPSLPSGAVELDSVRFMSEVTMDRNAMLAVVFETERMLHVAVA